MKSLFSLIFGVTLTVVLFIAGVAGATWLMSDPAPHQFANLDERPLWTNKPVEIDPQAQSFERIAAAPVPPVFLAMAVDVPDRETRSTKIASAGGALTNADLDLSTTGAVDSRSTTTLIGTAHAEWCQRRYTSYRVEDDTYQPYNGPRRSCESPYMARPETVAYGAEVNQPMVQADNSHVNWCLQRYRSYRIEDNSYQPYNGPRRACESPFG